jgi:hypothetical protein
MHRTRGIALLVALLVSVPLAASAGEQGAASRPFAPGGRVRMDLSAGDYTIQAGRDDQIHVRWETRTRGELADTTVDIQTRGGEATIVTDGPHNHFRVHIELPARSDVRVALSAGDLKMEGIVGNKDISSWAGNIRIDVGKVEDYKSVHAKVTAGDIKADAFHVSKGGLFRSFSWQGPGRYSLDVRLTAGDLSLRSGSGR